MSKLNSGILFPVAINHAGLEWDPGNIGVRIWSISSSLTTISFQVETVKSSGHLRYMSVRVMQTWRALLMGRWMENFVLLHMPECGIQIVCRTPEMHAKFYGLDLEKEMVVFENLA